MLRKYDLRKYVNTFKARSQTSLNEYNPTCGMCFILFLFQLIWPNFNAQNPKSAEILNGKLHFLFSVSFSVKKSNHDVKLKVRGQCYLFLK